MKFVYEGIKFLLWSTSQIVLLPGRWVMCWVGAADVRFRLLTYSFAAIFWVGVIGACATYDIVKNGWRQSLLASASWAWFVLGWLVGFFSIGIRMGVVVLSHGVHSEEHIQVHSDLMYLFGVKLHKLGNTNEWAYALSGCLPAIMVFAAANWVQEGNEKIVCQRGPDGKFRVTEAQCIVEDHALDPMTAAPQIFGNAAAMYSVIVLVAKYMVKNDPMASGELLELQGFVPSSTAETTLPDEP